MIHRFSGICTESCMTDWYDCLNYGKFPLCVKCVEMTYDEKIRWEMCFSRLMEIYNEKVSESDC